MNQNIELNDEIDLKELFLTLWRGKIFIIFLSTCCVFLASFHLQNTDRKYTVEYKLKPVSEKQHNQPVARLGGLASLAGIQIPANSNNDFKIFKELITSVETSEIIFENKKIINNIFKSEWNESLKNYTRPPQSELKALAGRLKKLLTGNKDVKYIPPDARRLAMYISKNIQINENKGTGFLNIISETSNPNLILSLIIEATEASDKIMRQRYIEFSTKPLAFYKEKLLTARSREHKETLASLIGAEEQKLMFASRGKYFIAEPYLNPTISLYPTSPNPKLVLVFSLVLGVFIGSALVLVRSIIVKDN